MDPLEISAQDTFNVINRPDTLIIDVREDYEYSGDLGHIKDSKLISMDKIEENLDYFKKNQEKTLIFVCRSGARSLHAVKSLHNLGIKNILSLNGGMISWNQSSFPIEK